MQHSSHLSHFSVSIFANARDNRADVQETPLSELLASFSEPLEVLEDLAYDSEELELEKASLPAWSPSAFRDNVRANNNVLTSSCLVFDLDQGSDGLKQGLTEQDFEELVSRLRSWEIAYALHTSFTSGFFHPRRKLRLVFPLERPATVAEYVKLWDEYSSKLPTKPDSTRRHPGGIFFAPAVLAKHRETFLFMSDDTKPLVRVGAKSGTFNLNAVKIGDERHYERVRLAEEKHNALNAAAFALALEKYPRSAEEVKAEIWPKLRAALEANTASGAPVRSWSAAENACDVAIREGLARAAEQPDPLKNLLSDKTPVSEKRARRAQLDLKKWLRAVEKDVNVLEKAAAALGRYVPNGWLDEDEVIKQLTTEAHASKSSLSGSEIASRIAGGLAAGKAQPISAVTEWMEQLETDDKGKIKATDENCWKILKAHDELEDVCAYNTRTGEAVIMAPPPWYLPAHRGACPVQITNADAGEIAVWLTEITGGTSFGNARALDTVLKLAEQNQFDPFKDYLEGLHWDGVERLKTWLIDYASAEDTEHNRAVGENWLTALVARTLEDDAKVDNMLVLLGKQGVGKSTLLRSLVPWTDLFTDYLPEKEADKIIALGRHSVVEVAELAAFGKQDNEYVKSLLSGRAESVRRPYGRVAERIVKRAVFAGTSNVAFGFLTDATGARRYWVVPVGQCKPAALISARDQLLAEAVHRYRTVRRWHLTEAEESLARAVQEEHRAPDMLADQLEELLLCVPKSERKHFSLEKDNSLNEVRLYTFKDQFDESSDVPNYITMEQAARYLDLDNKKHSGRLSGLFVQLGWKKVGRVSIEGKRVSKWVKE